MHVFIHLGLPSIISWHVRPSKWSRLNSPEWSICRPMPIVSLWTELILLQITVLAHRASRCVCVYNILVSAERASSTQPLISSGGSGKLEPTVYLISNKAIPGKSVLPLSNLPTGQTTGTRGGSKMCPVM